MVVERLNFVGRLWKSLSAAGLLLGTLFFAFSLTPSLLPRPVMLQGLVSGLSLAAGYAGGVIIHELWRYLEMPAPAGRVARVVKAVAAVVCLIVAAIFLRQASGWQDSIRLLMNMEAVEGARPFAVGFIALLLFAALLAIARLFRRTYLFIASQLGRLVPHRVSMVVGLVAAAALFWSIIDGVLFSAVLRAADRSFQQVDALIDADAEAPRDPLRTGSPESLLDWTNLGRAGRQFVSTGPTGAELSAYFGAELPDPVRVYVGLNSAPTTAERARLALDELLRVGAFDRDVLIVITPTGTGWVDPGAIDTVEYLHRGDIASVAVQYSYLASALSLMVEPDYGAESSRALFAEVYGHWTRLPKDRRPALYLHGLSLGALHSDRSFDIYDVVGDLFQGALWSGPPYRSETWRSVTARRAAGSPAWLPRFRDSSIIRFTDQNNRLDIPGVPWGPMRIAFLQYASDPVTFFEPQMLYRAPEWLAPPRGPDVSPELRWIPVVTMLQVAADMQAGDVTPRGHGHNYAAGDYLDTWVAVTGPADWTDEDTRRLKAHLADAR